MIYKYYEPRRNFEQFSRNGLSTVSLGSYMVAILHLLHWRTIERKNILQGNHYDNILTCEEKMI